MRHQFSPLQARRTSLRFIAAFGVAFFPALGRTQQEGASGVTKYSDSELLGLIIDTAKKACPAKWHEIVVEAEIGMERGKQRIGISFSVRLTKGGELQNITPREPIAAMNAASILQEQMFEDDERKIPWRKLRISYENGGSSVELDYDPEGLPK